jgi:hypothetical protein
MKLIDLKEGSWDIIVDETAGILTFEFKGSVLDQPEDIKIPFPISKVLAPIEAQISNPFAKWALGLLIQLL